jgi:hypothetical protein
MLPESIYSGQFLACLPPLEDDMRLLGSGAVLGIQKATTLQETCMLCNCDLIPV